MKKTFDPVLLEEMQMLIRLLVFAEGEADKHELDQCSILIRQALTSLSDEYDDLNHIIISARSKSEPIH